MAELNREDISDKRRKEVARKVINKLVNSKNLNTNKDGVKQQDLNDTVQILQKIVKLNIYSDNIDILAPASNILDDRNTKSWGKMKVSTGNKLISKRKIHFSLELSGDSSHYFPPLFWFLYLYIHDISHVTIPKFSKYLTSDLHSNAPLSLNNFATS